jgi:hypothetical protein
MTAVNWATGACGKVTGETKDAASIDMGKGAGYYGGNSTFNEYMNWGLVCLRFVDYAPRDEQNKMISMVEEMMTKRRGFPQFASFNKFLVDLYRNRKPNQPLAELYPQIIDWFENNNRQAQERH